MEFLTKILKTWSGPATTNTIQNEFLKANDDLQKMSGHDK